MSEDEVLTSSRKEGGGSKTKQRTDSSQHGAQSEFLDLGIELVDGLLPAVRTIRMDVV